MKKDGFQKCYDEVCRWENRGMVILFVVAIVDSVGILFGLKHVGASPVLRLALGIVIFAFTFGPVFWFVLGSAEMRKRMNLRCPHCGGLFNQVTMKHAITTGKCKRCDKAVFEDTAT